MEIRIIAGSLKGRKVRISGEASKFRPTKEAVRKAVADSLQKRIPGSVVADVCAGTGAWGFEMLSRGARAVFFIDFDLMRCRKIQEHADQFGVSPSCTVICSDVAGFIKEYPDRFDLVYFDPPYDDTTLAGLSRQVLCSVSRGGTLVYEHEKIVAPFTADGRTAVRTKKYGRTIIDYVSRTDVGGISIEDKRNINRVL
jgi:16S rRNA (guanine966-N2)-methyltransferase